MSQRASDDVHGFCLEEIRIGMCAEFEKTISEVDVEAFAHISGDTNPLHLDDEFARRTRVGERVVHGMVTASLISTLVGCKLPGPGCLWMGQTIHFLKPVKVGDRVTAHAEVTEIMKARQRVRMRTTCRVADITVIEGEALVWVPTLREKRSPYAN